MTLPSFQELLASARDYFGKKPKGKNGSDGWPVIPARQGGKRDSNPFTFF
jgi:hypothetical protein